MTKILILIDNFILEARSDLIYSTAQLVTTETARTNKQKRLQFNLQLTT
jgi:hypothetical protein